MALKARKPKARLKTVHFTGSLKPKKALIQTHTGSVHVTWQDVAGDWVWSTHGTGDKVQASALINRLNKWDDIVQKLQKVAV